MKIRFVLSILATILGDPAFVTFVSAANKCFADKSELKAAVDQYIDEEDCANNDGCAVGQIYGWPIGTWCVGNVTDMSQLFVEKSTFNEDLSGWDVSSVTDMAGMFWSALAFNGDISGWDVSSVTDMYAMFSDSAFNGDISKWDVSSVTSMYAMFEYSGFNSDISKWDVSSVTLMGEMFAFSSFNGDISKWNVSSVEYMGYMFWDNEAFNQDLCAWGDNFPYDNAEDIFANSSCTFQDTPQLDQGGPFCACNCTTQCVSY